MLVERVKSLVVISGRSDRENNSLRLGHMRGVRWLICELYVAGMGGNAELREFVKNVPGSGQVDNDWESIMRVLTANHVKVGS